MGWLAPSLSAGACPPGETMSTFVVDEQVTYRIEADTEDEALAKFLAMDQEGRERVACGVIARDVWRDA